MKLHVKSDKFGNSQGFTTFSFVESIGKLTTSSKSQHPMITQIFNESRLHTLIIDGKRI